MGRRSTPESNVGRKQASQPLSIARTSVNKILAEETGTKKEDKSIDPCPAKIEGGLSLAMNPISLNRDGRAFQEKGY